MNLPLPAVLSATWLTGSWLSLAEIAPFAAPELPAAERSLRRLAAGWRALGKQRMRAGTAIPEYDPAVLPGPVLARIGLARMRMAQEAVAKPAEAAVEGDASGTESAMLWARFNAATAAQKDEARRRLAIIDAAETLVDAGLNETAATAQAAREHGVSAATLWNWKRLARGVGRSDRLAVLAPRLSGASSEAKPERRAAIHAEAWAFLCSDYLRPEKPAFTACYDRLLEVAAQQGWGAIPAERSLRRRLDAEVAKEVQILARKGREAAKKLYPAQKRSVAHFRAMTAVNIDGHQLDVFARFADGPNGGKIARPHLLVIQDLFSGKILACRLAESENRETVRLAIGDMVERHGVPDKMWLDNGRAFASKWISGGTANRYRFKVRDEDPQGLLTALGVEIHWTNPFSGQSKPIERSFGDVMAERIARHPACAGAYTGNRPDAKPENYGKAAVPVDELRALVEREVAKHNARPGRKGRMCAGRSFDATFAASLAEPGTAVRRASAGQRALWLLAAERIRCSRGNGEIHFMGNRYWDRALTGLAGKTVTVRFDPDDLSAPLLVFDAGERLAAHAARIDDTGFDDVSAARDHARNRKAYLRSLNERRELVATMKAGELARMLKEAPAPETPSAPEAAVTALVTRNGARRKPAPVQAQESRTEWNETTQDAFARGLRLVAGRDVDV